MPSSFAKDVLADLSNATFSARGCDLRCRSDRQWIWQSCNEFGYFQTATGAAQPFGAFGGALDLKWAGREICVRAFSLPATYGGPRANAAGLHALTEYGGVPPTRWLERCTRRRQLPLSAHPAFGRPRVGI